MWLASWFGEYIAKSRIAVRREELVDELDEEVAELVAKCVAESGEEVGRDGGVVVSFHGSCFLLVDQFLFVAAKVGMIFGRMKRIWRIHCQT